MDVLWFSSGEQPIKIQYFFYFLRSGDVRDCDFEASPLVREVFGQLGFRVLF